MTKRMLVDATHAEETRVVVLDGSRLEDFDVETSTKKQLKGNIYLAKIVRVEPSLQAAFVEYGGGRHGFLAFSEIHPDYYQIPVADRERLLALQAEEAREEAEREEEAATGAAPAPHPAPADEPPFLAGPEAPAQVEPVLGQQSEHVVALPAEWVVSEREPPPPAPTEPETEDEPTPAPDAPRAAEAAAPPDPAAPVAEAAPDAEPHNGPDPYRPAQAAAIEREEVFGLVAEEDPPAVVADTEEAPGPGEIEPGDIDVPPADMPPPETIGGDNDSGDGAEEARARRTARFLRNYRIQEVIKRRQIMLVQVVKEERGTKGAALTTYISLAGRYCVLMPNSPRGGGISRKITSATDRRRLKEITAELEIPPGMGLIVRTAGANRPKPEIKRDCEYLMRLWDDIREHTLKSVAPALIYEEASLIKRAIRDVYSRDIDEVTVDGEEGWRAAHDFMRMLMPSHAKKVQLWRGNGQPLFAKYQVEAQLDAMLAPTVQLRSGGYLVINQTEALVAIDVNSGRSTRERGIEETALRTNLEAADEVARQLRLRDLAGLIVIDFIDMEARKHNAMVERRLKEALKIDRARIQVGHISHFGLLEMSRQRLRPSLAETSFSPCPHCGGTGHVRSTESSAIHVLRAIEDEGAKSRASAIRVQVAGNVALYLLNHKRERLADIEQRCVMRVIFEADETLVPPQIRIERLRPPVPEAERPVPVAPAAPPALPAHDEEEAAAEDETEAEAAAEEAAPAATAEARAAGEEAERRRRRRRRRRGGRRDAAVQGQPAAEGEAEAEAETESESEAEAEQASFAAAEPGDDEAAPEMPAALLDPSFAEQPLIDPEAVDEAGQPRGRRRGRRGGRRRAGGELGTASADAEAPPAAYAGPTPADPFGGVAFDLFDMMEESIAPAPIQQAVPVAPPPTPAPPAPHIEPMVSPEPEAHETLIVELLPSEAPAPVAEEPPPAPEATAPLPEPPAAEPAPEPPPAAPAVQPILIGAEETQPAERKRGWWRR